MAADKATTELEGTIVENLPNTMFRVKLADERVLLCHLAGKMRLHFVRLLPGDRVKMSMTQYDQERARIIYKLNYEISLNINNRV